MTTAEIKQDFMALLLDFLNQAAVGKNLNKQQPF